jgi:hypothetical protein
MSAKAWPARIDSTINASQRAAIQLQKSWQRLGLTDMPPEVDPNAWWLEMQARNLESLPPRQRSLRESFEKCLTSRGKAQEQLRSWLIRYNKTEDWANLPVKRRLRFCGAGINNDQVCDEGLAVPRDQLLPFFLAARIAASPGKELLGEALCSSYEAFRHTREHNQHRRDVQEEVASVSLARDSTPPKTNKSK